MLSASILTTLIVQVLEDLLENDAAFNVDVEKRGLGQDLPKER